MGRDLFDYAFKEYARRWAFKHPTPADFFRTMEDASGEDLDWFWRGWFYSTDACDIALDSVKYAKPDVNAQLPPARERLVSIDKPAVNAFEDISKIRNKADKSVTFYTDKDKKTRDFYWGYARGLEKVDTTVRKQANNLPIEQLSSADKSKYANKHLYELSFSNKGGLIMPVIVEFTYADGSKKIDRIPAQIWRLNENNASKLYVENQEVVAIKLDPMRETADIDETNNTWGGEAQPSKFQLFKQKSGGAARGQSVGISPMQAAKKSK